MSNRSIKTTIRILISAVLIAILIYKIDFETIIISLRSFSPVLLVPPSIFYLFTCIIATYRWHILLRASEIVLPFWSSLEYYLIGFFFSNFLPTGIGGDLVRIYLASQWNKNASTVTSTVILERVLGFGATLLVAFILSPFATMRTELKYMLALLNLIFYGFLLLTLNEKTNTLLKKLFSFLPNGSIKDFSLSTIESLYSFRYKPLSVGLSFLFSLLYQSALIYFYFMVGKLLRINIPLVEYLAYLPLIWVVSLVPISLNAIGVREAGFSFFFKEVGESPALGFMNSILGFAITVGISIIGGVLFVVRKERKVAPVEVGDKRV